MTTGSLNLHGKTFGLVAKTREVFSCREIQALRILTYRSRWKDGTKDIRHRDFVGFGDKKDGKICHEKYQMRIGKDAADGVPPRQIEKIPLSFRIQWFKKIEKIEKQFVLSQTV